MDFKGLIDFICNRWILVIAKVMNNKKCHGGTKMSYPSLLGPLSRGAPVSKTKSKTKQIFESDVRKCVNELIIND